MAQRLLTKQDLLSWVDALAHDYRVIAPVRDEGGDTFLQEIAAAAEVDWEVGRPVNSIKEFLFPATEEILHVRRGKTAVDLRVPQLDRSQVLLAVRPCDAAALTSMDALFLDEPADLYWSRRRENSILVGLACLEVPTPECFCTTVGGSPLGTANLDVMLYADGAPLESPLELGPAPSPELASSGRPTGTNGAGYVAEALTERGEALLASAGGRPLEQPYVPQAPDLPPLPCPSPAEWLRLFEDPYWERLGERCLGCKICTYNCPTCYCFDIRDRGIGGEVERLRAWDACTSKHYSVEASGHDPRPTRGARLRNRFYHKYYYFPWRYEGMFLCSGCGRCVAQCPVNIDLTQILEDVSTLAKSHP